MNIKKILEKTLLDLRTNGRVKGMNHTINETVWSLPGAIAKANGHLVSMHNMSKQARATVKAVGDVLGVPDLEVYNDHASDGEVLKLLEDKINELAVAERAA